MASPARDVHNVTVDDVLSSNRQREIEELAAVLRRFRPTKIALESHVRSRTLGERYARYVAGDHVLTRNEIDQVGLRLAKSLGHERVYPVDEDGEFPYYRVLNYAKANGRLAEFEAANARTGARVRAESEYLRTHSVLETLVLMNADSSVARAVAEYYATYAPLGEPFEYAGPDLIARWFERNIRIYHNIRALVTSPNDRILVVYGAGHTGWLQQNVANDAELRLRRLSEFLVSSDR
jgi:hypothetical protein